VVFPSASQAVRQAGNSDHLRACCFVKHSCSGSLKLAQKNPFVKEICKKAIAALKKQKKIKQLPVS
jgi:hypothetical protein